MKQKRQKEIREAAVFLGWVAGVVFAGTMLYLSLQRFAVVKIATFESMTVPIAELLIGLIVLVGVVWHFRHKSSSVNVIILGILAIFLSAGLAHLGVNFDHLPVQHWLPESLALFAGTTTASFLLHALSPHVQSKPKNKLRFRR